MIQMHCRDRHCQRSADLTPHRLGSLDLHTVPSVRTEAVEQLELSDQFSREMHTDGPGK